MIRKWRGGDDDLRGLLAEAEQLAQQLRGMASDLAVVAEQLEAEKGARDERP